MSFIYQSKSKNLHAAGKCAAASCAAPLTRFLWLSQLSKPSAVCFPLTFSSCAQTLSEVLLTEPGLWEWADSQHWLEISSSNWISRRGGSHYPYMEVGNEKNTPAFSQYSLNGTTSSSQMCRYVSLRAADSAWRWCNSPKEKEPRMQRGQFISRVSFVENVWFFGILIINGQRCTRIWEESGFGWFGISQPGNNTPSLQRAAVTAVLAGRCQCNNRCAWLDTAAASCGCWYFSRHREHFGAQFQKKKKTLNKKKTHGRN